MDNLFEPLELNKKITLKNRIIMAPLTRCMADDDLVPTQDMADYYARRAETGLIISEATIIRPDGQGYPNTPGIFTDKQIQGWKKVTSAVHQAGGKIFMQLWHTGRVAHPHFFGGDVIAPSNIGLNGTIPRMRELSYVTPKPVTKNEIIQLAEDYRQAAINALEAGFDGIELHGANGYLIDQFLHHSCNEREDEFGGSVENMARFPLMVIDTVVSAIGRERTALRLSPGAYFKMEPDHRDRDVFDYLLQQLKIRNLCYLHIGIFDESMAFDYLGGTVGDYIRTRYDKTLIGVGGLTPETASEAIKTGKYDLVAIGRPLIANPDYVQKVKMGVPLVDYEDSMLLELI